MSRGNGVIHLYDYMNRISSSRATQTSERVTYTARNELEGAVIMILDLSNELRQKLLKVTTEG